MGWTNPPKETTARIEAERNDTLTFEAMAEWMAALPNPLPARQWSVNPIDVPRIWYELTRVVGTEVNEADQLGLSNIEPFMVLGFRLVGDDDVAVGYVRKYRSDVPGFVEEELCWKT